MIVVMPVTRSKRRKVTPGDVARLYCMSKSDPRHILKKYIDPWIGYGLFASQDIVKGDFIAEYRGSLIFEEHLQSDSCFHYYFTYQGKSVCIDASNVECLAKYANDSYEGGNSSMKVLEYNNRPHLCLFATKDIKVEDEIMYDYGVQDAPWRIRQNKNWPHRLTECDGNVDSCSVCDNPSSSIEWNGFSCFDCGDMWHESCFKKISTDERCCLKKKERVVETEITGDPHVNSSTSGQERCDRLLENTSHDPTDASLEYSCPDDIHPVEVNQQELKQDSSMLSRQKKICDSMARLVVETEITGDPHVNPATSGQERCDRLLENTSHDPTDASLECSSPDDIHPVEVNQQDLKQDSSMLSKNECSINRSAMLMLLAMSQPVHTSSEQQNIPPPPSSPNPFEDEDLVSLFQETVMSDPDEEVSQNKTQTLGISIESDSSMNTFHGMYKSSDGDSSDESDVFPVYKMPPEYLNQPSTSTASWSGEGQSSSDASQYPNQPSTSTASWSCDEGQSSSDASQYPNQPSTSTALWSGDEGQSSSDASQYPSQSSTSSASWSGEGQSSSDAPVTCETAQTYKKPYRLCPFCDTAKSKLSQHIAAKHKDEKCVADVLALPKKEKALGMSTFKKMGILKVNKEQAKGDNPAYERERSSNDNADLVMCCHCSGFYGRTYLKRHTKICQGDSSVPSVPVPIHLFSIEEDSNTEFATEVLAKFRRDEIGTQCTTDPVLQLIGRRLWFKEKRKVDKKMEVRRSVMSSMRRLSSLYLELVKQEEELGKLPERNGNTSDLFQRSNFAHLEGAIECYTSLEKHSTKDVKAGLKNALYYLLKSAAKILKASYLIEDQDEEAAKIDKFVAVLELNYNYLFGDAVYKTQQQRQVKLRRPEALPQEEDLKELRRYIIENMLKLSSDTAVADIHHFVLLRDLVVCRLTLFNARRGGEPARLLIREWEDAERGAWLDANRLENLEELDRALASSLAITYQSGKGSKHLVPVLFPSDTLEPIRKLNSKEWRIAASINRDNPYLFPSTNGSENHVSGWHSVYQCCEKLNLRDPTLITATKNRHRISTLFALMDVPELEREYFYKHLGHSKETNCNIYQAPLAIKEMTVVGRRLQTIDEGDDDELFSQDERSTMSNDSSPSPDTSSTSDESCFTDGDGGNERKVVSCRLDVSKARRYTIWNREESDAVRTFFRDYYNREAVKKLPGKKDVMEFLNENPAFCKDWKAIRTKVMNDIRLQAKKASNREKGWVSGSH